MQIVNVHQAKTNLSKLLNDVAKGKEVVIAKAGKPVAKLVDYKPKINKRKPGFWKGKIWISPDFNDEDEEINKLFYESDE